MRILYIHQHFVTPKGSGGIRSYAMARKLIERGHSVTMVCGSAQGGTTGLSGDFVRGQRRGRVDGIDVIELNLAYANSHGFVRRILTFLGFALRSVLIALTHRYDLIFATTTPLTAGIPGIVARWLRGKPFVFEVRDLWPELPRAMGVIRNPLMLWAMGALEWLSYRSAHKLIGLSPGIVQGIQARGVCPEKIAMIPNGCDLDIFASDDQPWRPEAVAATDLMAVFAGTHGQANGLDAVLDTAHLLQQRGRRDIKLVLIGNGKLKPALQASALEQGLDNVLFLQPVNKARLSGLMRATDLGLQVLANVPAFYYGTSPNKFFDYIAAGVPVLNNYPGWLADMINEHECGYAIPPADPQAFADVLEQAQAEPERLRSMGINARQLAQSRFDRDALSDQWVTWLEESMP